MACDDNEAAARYRPTMADDPFSPDTLPLFPLGSVLFPGGSLPLQVFEVRYLDMIGRRHRAGQPFGVVALAQGREVVLAPAPPTNNCTPWARWRTSPGSNRPNPGYR